MIAWTRGRTLAAGAALILLTNAVALSGVFINRSGEPESRLMLSERELSLPYRGYRQAENSGLALTLTWRVLDADEEGSDYGSSNYGVQPTWLDAAHLATLGFETSAGNATQEARERLARQLPRQVLVVFENAGPAWRQAVERARAGAARQAAAAAANPGSEAFAKQARAGQERVALEENHFSRLFAIDAGRDAATLRSRYPDRSRYLILRGTIRPTLRRHDRQYQLGGYISGVAITHINVPFALRPLLEPLRNAPQPLPDASTPRYEVQLTVGQRLEPWIETLTTPAAKP
ncbi:MAG: DUF4824 family protein [Candidatus Accumulibacter sp.]|nr:DUF4824 family protein [Candidatus Accumulibacter propinquus]